MPTLATESIGQLGLGNLLESKIDPLILEWAKYLIQNNFRTIGSCQGCGRQPTTHYKYPQITIDADNGKTLKETVQRLRQLVGEECTINIIGGSSKFRERILFIPPYDITIERPNVETENELSHENSL